MTYKTKRRLAFFTLGAILGTMFALSNARADVKITALPAATALGGTEPFAAVQSGVTVRATPAQISTYTFTQLTSSTITGKFSGSCTVASFLRGDGACAAVDLTAAVSGLLPVANGGTGQGSLATDNLFMGNGTGAMSSKAIPTCSTASSALTYNTTTHAWGCNSIAAGGSPGGSTTQVQYNNAGAFAGDANFTWDLTNRILTVGNSSQGTIQAAAGNASLLLRGGTGGAGAGGAISLAGGPGGVGAGGNASLTGGTGSSGQVGGTVTVQAGTGGSGAAGNLATVQGGSGGASNGPGGGVSLVAGTPNGTGTVADISFSTPSTATQTGRVSFQDTSSDPYLLVTRTPANASYTGTVIAGATQKGISAGVSVTLQGGQSSTAPGNLNLQGGVCSGASCATSATVAITGSTAVGTNIAGGPVTITGGTPSGSGQGGNVSITGGVAGTLLAGNVTITGGNTSGSGVTGGTASLVGGNGTTAANGGSAIVQGGNGNTTGSGGDARVLGGTAGASAGATGGFVKLTGGTASNGPGGDIQITASNAVTQSGATGGNVTITSGNGSGAGTAGGGGISLTTGNGGATAGASGGVAILTGTPTDGNSGSISLTTANAVGTNRSGGNISLNTGTGTGSGTQGVVQINGNPIAVATSGTFTATFTAGFTTTPTQNFAWAKVGNICTVRTNGTITGTSNANTFSTASGALPATCRPAGTTASYTGVPVVQGAANSNGCIGFLTDGTIQYGTADSNLACFLSAASSFATSGTKAVNQVNTTTQYTFITP